MSGTSIALDGEKLGHLMECLVIHYEHQPESGTFVIVADSWEKPGDGRRAFIRILFSGVEAWLHVGVP